MKTIATLAFAALVAASAAGTAAAKHPRADYAAYAGAPIQEFRFTQLYNWQRTGDKSVVVWTKPSTAYLLTLKHNCDALRGRVTVEIGGVDGIQGRLQAGSGDVIIGTSTTSSRIAVWTDKADKLVFDKQVSLSSGKTIYDAVYDQKLGKIFATVDNRLVSFPFTP